MTALSGVAPDDEGDTIYAIDRVAEHVLVAEIGGTIATPDAPVRLVAEGLPGGEVVVPEGADRRTSRWIIIVDPIDGTRGLMYQKRPAWILTGVARGPGPCTLADIELAVQTEIPLVKQHLSDELWAVRGQGAAARSHQPPHRRQRSPDAAAVDGDDARARVCDDLALLSRAVAPSSPRSTTK